VVFWIVTPCSVVANAAFSEDRAAEDGGSTVLRNHYNTGARTQDHEFCLHLISRSWQSFYLFCYRTTYVGVMHIWEHRRFLVRSLRCCCSQCFHSWNRDPVLEKWQFTGWTEVLFPVYGKNFLFIPMSRLWGPLSVILTGHLGTLYSGVKMQERDANDPLHPIPS